MSGNRGGQRARTRIATLSALAALAAGIQALAPTSVLASLNQDDSGLACVLGQEYPNSCPLDGRGGGEVILIEDSTLGGFEGHGGRSIGTPPEGSVGADGPRVSGSGLRGAAARKRKKRAPSYWELKEWEMKLKELDCSEIYRSIEWAKGQLTLADIADKRGVKLTLGRFIKNTFDPMLGIASPWLWAPFEGGRAEALAHLRRLERKLVESQPITLGYDATGKPVVMTCADLHPLTVH